MNNWLVKYKHIFTPSERFKKIAFWSTLLLIVAILFVCFIYSDILITTKHSMNFWSGLYYGRPMNFYLINHNLVIDQYLNLFTMPSYDFPIFIIFAVWNFPLWIAQFVFHIQITDSLICLFWLKSILVVFLGLSVFVIKKICVEVGIIKKNIPWLIFMFMSSPLLLISMFIMSQYDIIAIFFMLLGVLMFIKGNMKWFIIWFAIAIPLKMFALFIFIPLVLLNNKKILQIIRNLFLGLLPFAGVKLLSSFMPMYKESTSGFSIDMLSRLFADVIGVNFGGVSLFSICLVAIAIFCYSKVLSDKDERSRYAIYVPFIVFASFFAFVQFHPYWIILIVPFLAIMIFQNMKRFKINILLDIALSVSFIFSTIIIYPWCYGPFVVQRMLIPKLFGSTYGTELGQHDILSILTRFDIPRYMPFLLAIFVVSLAALAIINFPKKSVELQERHQIEWGLLFMRMLIIVPIPILMVYCYYAR